MSYTIPEIYPPQFSSNIETAIQQTSSILDDTVTPFNFDGKYKDMLFSSTIDWETATDGRMAQTNLAEYNLNKRWVLTKKIKVPVPPAIDEWDDNLLAQISAPGSDIINAITFGYNRKKEKEIISAVESAVYIGADAPSSTTAFPSANVIAHGSTGLTFAKVAQIIKLARKQNVDPSMLVGVISPEDEEYLISNVNELRNKDYSAVQPIEGGSVAGKTWMGLKWRVCNQLTTDTTAHTVNALFYPKSAIRFNFGTRKTAMEVRADRDGAIQFRSSARLGGARAQDNGVFIVKSYYASIA